VNNKNKNQDDAIHNQKYRDAKKEKRGKLFLSSYTNRAAFTPFNGRGKSMLIK
jgi:hypothetical protein